MNILAIDTVTELCSVALFVDGRVTQRLTDLSNSHSRVLLPMINELLLEAAIELSDLDGIAFDRGPGSFTGLRIGAGVAQGLSFSSGVPLRGISSLAALARRCEGNVVVALDARMNQVYTASFKVTNGNVVSLGAEQLIPPRELQIQDDTIPIGNGWRVYEELIELTHEEISRGDVNATPLADDILALSIHQFERGEVSQFNHGLPVYIRDNVTG